MTHGGDAGRVETHQKHIAVLSHTVIVTTDLFTNNTFMHPLGETTATNHYP